MIDHYKFGRITVDGRVYDQDLKLYPDGVVPDWWRHDGHELRPNDVPELAGKRLDFLVVGTGAHGAMKLTAAAEWLFDEIGLAWLALQTGEALKEFNRRLAGGERVGAVVHLTC